MSLIPQFKTELQYIPTVKACLKLSGVDCSKESAGQQAGLTADCRLQTARCPLFSGSSVFVSGAWS